uniref:Uncharacterized protein n=1 Tax=Leptocylindrus danicus TaxID=163516 RepID=A0A7S2K0F5_9STRA|eukprot:CAMPEP_0116037746 /NCGR_PEP_ID=MMETSP0321-20121206/22265_1 /TAXON_ID=163516 /ORGANISM="Leptocylindrus danicus var. danicus, Strain B650" /LENGTH=614 /DNA_ID=CAMNT_0003516065 /DNA_START=230 /DNA_END=2074 /DNA_ORIENTATION=+
MFYDCNRTRWLYGICLLLYLVVGCIVNFYYLRGGAEDIIAIAEKDDVPSRRKFPDNEKAQQMNNDETQNNTNPNKNRADMYSSSIYDPTCPFVARKPASLLPGDLPGYTGWPRRVSLTVADYSIVSIEGFTVENNSVPKDKLVHHITDSKAGSLWSVLVHCPTKECRDSSPAFYARSYGPAIITGDIRSSRKHASVLGSEDENNVDYEVQFRYKIPGKYIVELVLESEDAVTLSNFPRLNNEWEPTYEGWLLPGFPLQIEVVDSDTRDASLSHASNRWCSAGEIVADTNGQWVVTGRYDQKMRDSGQIKDFGFRNGDSMLRGYREGYSSSGFCTKYFMGSNCELLPAESLMSGKMFENNTLSQCLADASVTTGTPIRLILIGDSVTNALRSMLIDEFSVDDSSGLIQIELLITSGGLAITLEQTLEALEKLRIDHQNDQFIIIFNAGLHELDKYCKASWAHWRSDHDVPPDWKYGDCLENYKHYFKVLVEFITQYPAELKIFRTTNAGWMRWGNFGFAWGADRTQSYLKSPFYVQMFNTAAIEIVKQSGEGIHIIDFYRITLARPDNTEVRDAANPTGAHLVHPGVAPLRVLTRKLMMLIMWQVCGSTLENLPH